MHHPHTRAQTSKSLNLRRFRSERLSRHAQPCVSLLSQEEKGIRSEIHEAGFSAIYSLLEGRDVTCPICMCSVDQPVITNCCHAFCKVRPPPSHYSSLTSRLTTSLSCLFVLYDVPPSRTGLRPGPDRAVRVERPGLHPVRRLPQAPRPRQPHADGLRG